MSIHVLIDDAVEAVQGALDAKATYAACRASPIPDRCGSGSGAHYTGHHEPPHERREIHARRRPHSFRVGIEGQFLVISVRDNGVGLTADAMRRVFDMFTRIESEVGRSEGGLGIGLALAKGLVQLHGGRIEVNSAGPGLGSEFLICLPRSLILEAPAASGNPPARRGPPPGFTRILVADDNRDSAESLSMLLQISGHQVHSHMRVSEAFEIAKKMRPDIGIFDIGMPDLNGYELAERIRHEAWGEKITLIAVTGWGQESDKRRAFAGRIRSSFDQAHRSRSVGAFVQKNS